MITEVTVNNLKELYNSLSRNVQDESKKLGEIYETVENAKTEKEAIYRELEQAKKEISSTLARKDEERINVEKIKKQGEDLAILHEIEKTDHLNKLKELQAATKVAGETFNSVESLARLSHDRKLSIERDISSATAEKERVQNDLSVIKLQKLQVISQLDKEIDQKEAENAALSKEKVSLEKAVSELDKELVEKSKNIKGFKQNIIAFHENLSNTVKDIMIRELRLARLYKELGVETKFDELKVPELPNLDNE